MPYIKQEDRELYDDDINNLVCSLINVEFEAGHVVYIFYKVVVAWYNFNRKFTTINNIRGALWSTLVEFDRIFASGYEDNKRRINGDIHE